MMQEVDTEWKLKMAALFRGMQQEGADTHRQQALESKQTLVALEKEIHTRQELEAAFEKERHERMTLETICEETLEKLQTLQQDHGVLKDEIAVQFRASILQVTKGTESTISCLMSLLDLSEAEKKRLSQHMSSMKRYIQTLRDQLGQEKMFRTQMQEYLKSIANPKVKNVGGGFEIFSENRTQAEILLRLASGVLSPPTSLS